MVAMVTAAWSYFLDEKKNYISIKGQIQMSLRTVMTWSLWGK